MFLREHRHMGPEGGGVSCPDIFPIACPKIKWFCLNITCFFFPRKWPLPHSLYQGVDTGHWKYGLNLYTVTGGYIIGHFKTCIIVFNYRYVRYVDLIIIIIALLSDQC